MLESSLQRVKVRRVRSRKNSDKHSRRSHPHPPYSQSSSHGDADEALSVISVASGHSRLESVEESMPQQPVSDIHVNGQAHEQEGEVQCGEDAATLSSQFAAVGAAEAIGEGLDGRSGVSSPPEATMGEVEAQADDEHLPQAVSAERDAHDEEPSLPPPGYAEEDSVKEELATLKEDHRKLQQQYDRLERDYQDASKRWEVDQRRLTVEIDALKAERDATQTASPGPSPAERRKSGGKGESSTATWYYEQLKVLRQQIQEQDERHSKDVFDMQTKHECEMGVATTRHDSEVRQLEAQLADAQRRIRILTGEEGVIPTGPDVKRTSRDIDTSVLEQLQARVTLLQTENSNLRHALSLRPHHADSPMAAAAASGDNALTVRRMSQQQQGRKHDTGDWGEGASMTSESEVASVIPPAKAMAMGMGMSMGADSEGGDVGDQQDDRKLAVPPSRPARPPKSFTIPLESGADVGVAPEHGEDSPTAQLRQAHWELSKMRQRLFALREFQLLIKGCVAMTCRLCGRVIQYEKFPTHLRECSARAEGHPPPPSPSLQPPAAPQFSRDMPYGLGNVSLTLAPIMNALGSNVSATPSSVTSASAEKKGWDEGSATSSVTPPPPQQGVTGAEAGVPDDAMELIEEDEFICKRIRISIPETSRRTDRKGREFQSYTIRIDVGSRGWSVAKRYREFLALQRQLERAFPEMHFPHDVPKPTLKQADQREVEGRRTRLSHYLDMLIRIKNVRDFQAFRRFLELDEHLNEVDYLL
ncbi:unnamed protein product [Vitrella brassicaformis CCMP3155]|uniref:PX domain-containing protein n=3 Tax=Vitrella brassicaformis TaxID=1169539 RepID=A0A0G4GVK0_VITBC|nr:unnamed protein product [Vitrella brassicaformis CCMP3155]|eukprot:CEM34969.1 unnamed protein product [Vitrella brassicaformis CCMP3155]